MSPYLGNDVMEFQPLDLVVLSFIININCTLSVITIMIPLYLFILWCTIQRFIHVVEELMYAIYFLLLNPNCYYKKEFPEVTKACKYTFSSVWIDLNGRDKTKALHLERYNNKCKCNPNFSENFCIHKNKE